MTILTPSGIFGTCNHDHSRRFYIKKLLYVLVICVAISGSVCHAFAVPYPYGEPEFSATIVGDYECTPGNVTPLLIKVANVATNPELILDVSNPVESTPIVPYAVLLTLEPGNSPADIIHTVQTLPALPPATGIPLTFPVIIPADAPAGPYYLDLNIQYQYADSIAKDGLTDVFHYTTKEVTLKIPIVVKEKVRVRVDNISASYMAPGQVGIISADITNVGYYSGKNASAELTTAKGSPVTIYQGGYHLGTFDVGETRSVEWRASVSDKLDASSIPAVVQISYEDKNQNLTKSQPVSIGIPVSAGPKFNITYDRPKITPGGSTVVRVTYINTGDAPAFGATAKIVPVNPVSSKQTGGMLGTIAPGESVTTDYEFSLSQKALVKPYGVLTDIKFRGEDGSVYLSDPLKIELNTIEPGIIAILLSPVSLVILIGVILVFGYLFLRKEGRLI
ncbi:COG1361 S-layer family protein [Methanospirillum lacunae]|uniref:S-layer protein n=1 Tax=Methanospirillum lacunae TaxID=668570 RepID=A0A2V2MY53_9EURY|nr:hypothetical protein [Methanospirillum lacunae]PWR73064.1 hypothetical protein DK846_05635 [Methanospirillum lacunae]